MECKTMAELFKVLGDETRLEILKLLQYKTMCANTLLEKLSITQPTLSYHMQMLGKYGLVHFDKCGKMKNYTLNQEKFKLLAAYFEHSVECAAALSSNK